jgi:hypothetical protein
MPKMITVVAFAIRNAGSSSIAADPTARLHGLAELGAVGEVSVEITDFFDLGITILCIRALGDSSTADHL